MFRGSSEMSFRGLEFCFDDYSSWTVVSGFSARSEISREASFVVSREISISRTRSM